MIEHPAFTDDPWGGARVGPAPRRPGPDRVDLRPVQRAHRDARQPRRGRAARPARHLPQLGLRAAATALRRDAATATPSRRRRSSTSPTARSSGSSSTTSPSTSATGSLDHHERVLDLRAGTLRRDGPVDARRPDRRSGSRSTRLVSFTQRSVAAISYEVEPIDTAVRVVVQSELVANETLPDLGRDPRVGRRPRGAPPARGATTSHGAVAHHGAPDPSSGLRVAAAMDHEIEGPEGTQVGPDGASATSAGSTVAARLAPGQRPRLVKFVAYGWSSRRSRPALHDQVVAALADATPDRVGRPARRAATVPRRVLGRGRRRGRRRRRGAAGGPLRAVPGAPGRRPGRAAADRGQGPDRPGLRRPHLLGHRDLRAAGAHLHPPDGGCRRAALAPLVLPEAERQRDPARAWPAPHSPGGRSAARSARATGRPERRPSTSTPTSPTRCSATSTRPGTRSSSDGPPCRSSWPRPALWRSLGHHDLDGRFRIDGVTGPDEYSAIADNNVYTNLMAQQNLRAAAEIAGRFPERRPRPGGERRRRPPPGGTRPSRS